MYCAGLANCVCTVQVWLTVCTVQVWLTVYCAGLANSVCTVQVWLTVCTVQVWLTVCVYCAGLAKMKEGGSASRKRKAETTTSNGSALDKCDRWDM